VSKVSRDSFVGPALAASGALVWLAMAVEWFRGVRRVGVSREVRRNRQPLERYPSVSVIVPTRNEEGAWRGR
jgi:hypothetical protein